MKRKRHGTGEVIRKLREAEAMREGVMWAVRTLGVSQRRACKAVGQPRSTQRFTPTKPATDRPLVASMLALASKHPRYGYGVPTHIRSDNGPEFIAWRVRAWLEGNGVGRLYIEPGAP